MGNMMESLKFTIFEKTAQIFYFKIIMLRNKLKMFYIITVGLKITLIEIFFNQKCIKIKSS